MIAELRSALRDLLGYGVWKIFLENGPDSDMTGHPLRGCVRPSIYVFFWVADSILARDRPADISTIQVAMEAAPSLGRGLAEPCRWPLGLGKRGNNYRCRMSSTIAAFEASVRDRFT